MLNIQKEKLIMTSKDLELYFDAVTAEDIGDIIRFLKLSNYEESNHNYLNMMIWKHWYPLYKVKEKNYYLLLGMHEGELFLFMPLCKSKYFDEALIKAKSIFDRYDVAFILSCFTKEMAIRATKLFPSLNAYHVPESSDYIYDTNKLIHFSGKKLQKKRNHLNAFYSQYENRYNYESLNEENVVECLHFLSTWKAEEVSDDDYFINEKLGVENILRNYTTYKYKGGCIRIDGEIKAFAIGSELTKTMCQMNVEKADSEIRGLYQAIMKEVLIHEFSEYEECNREDDLGRENIRKAKRAYAPKRMIDKYRLSEG